MKLKNFGLKQGGFTLIELLVVIVIIGILATISVATFSNYFAKARDTERTAAVRNIATIMKTARAVEEISAYNDTDKDTAALDNASQDYRDFLAAQGGYIVPDDASGINYFIYANANDFAVFACKEETLGDASGTTAAEVAFIDGTPDAIAAVTVAIAENACVTTPINPAAIDITLATPAVTVDPIQLNN